jgi:hypothetical protein
MKLLCKIGVHLSTYNDSAMFSRAERCNDCGQATNKKEFAVLEKERHLWSMAPKDEDLESRSLWVLARLMGTVAE